MSTLRYVEVGSFRIESEYAIEFEWSRFFAKTRMKYNQYWSAFHAILFVCSVSRIFSITCQTWESVYLLLQLSNKQTVSRRTNTLYLSTTLEWKKITCENVQEVRMKFTAWFERRSPKRIEIIRIVFHLHFIFWFCFFFFILHFVTSFQMSLQYSACSNVLIFVGF